MAHVDGFPVDTLLIKFGTNPMEPVDHFRCEKRGLRQSKSVRIINELD